MTKKCEKCGNIWFASLYIHPCLECYQKKYTGLFYNISLTYLPAKACGNACKKSKLMVSSQIGRKRPQKRKDSGLVLNWGTSTYAGGVTKKGTL